MRRLKYYIPETERPETVIGKKVTLTKPKLIIMPKLIIIFRKVIIVFDYHHLWNVLFILLCRMFKSVCQRVPFCFDTIGTINTIKAISFYEKNLSYPYHLSMD